MSISTLEELQKALSEKTKRVHSEEKTQQLLYSYMAKGLGKWVYLASGVTVGSWSSNTPFDAILVTYGEHYKRENGTTDDLYIIGYSEEGFRVMSLRLTDSGKFAPNVFRSKIGNWLKHENTKKWLQERNINVEGRYLVIPPPQPRSTLLEEDESE